MTIFHYFNVHWTTNRRYYCIQSQYIMPFCDNDWQIIMLLIIGLIITCLRCNNLNLFLGNVCLNHCAWRVIELDCQQRGWGVGWSTNDRAVEILFRGLLWQHCLVFVLVGLPIGLCDWCFECWHRLLSWWVNVCVSSCESEWVNVTVWMNERDWFIEWVTEWMNVREGGLVYG